MPGFGVVLQKPPFSLQLESDEQVEHADAGHGNEEEEKSSELDEQPVDPRRLHQAAHGRLWKAVAELRRQHDYAMQARVG